MDQREHHPSHSPRCSREDSLGEHWWQRLFLDGLQHRPCDTQRDPSEHSAGWKVVESQGLIIQTCCVVCQLKTLKGNEIEHPTPGHCFHCYQVASCVWTDNDRHPRTNKPWPLTYLTMFDLQLINFNQPVFFHIGLSSFPPPNFTTAGGG